MTSKTRGTRAPSALSELRAHVEVCDLRYKNIDDRLERMEKSSDQRLGRMEKIMLGVAGTSFTTLLGAVAFLLMHGKFSF